MKLTSSVFSANGDIPAKYTCEGDNVSPPLSWSGAPDGTKSLVLIVDDPDAPDPAAPKRVWVHWVVYNLPPSPSELPEAAAALPGNARQGLNDWNKPGYGGPCPPIGKHRYVHKLYALDVTLPDLGSAKKSDLEKAMESHVLAKTELIGTYQKRGK
ncbi:MAG TPA: YbhB/YbcL family Raf kinase inhibitor-like protein [Polyangiaceae bacterium]|nr:YbhB/YbcL family Raf kinase inhibitor-like protein [Polyangiaceae bacterium]